MAVVVCGVRRLLPVVLRAVPAGGVVALAGASVWIPVGGLASPGSAQKRASEGGTRVPGPPVGKGGAGEGVHFGEIPQWASAVAGQRRSRWTMRPRNVFNQAEKILSKFRVFA